MIANPKNTGKNNTPGAHQHPPDSLVNGDKGLPLRVPLCRLADQPAQGQGGEGPGARAGDVAPVQRRRRHRGRSGSQVIASGNAQEPKCSIILVVFNNI